MFKRNRTYVFIRADQNTGGALLEFSMRTAMHGTSCVSSAISVRNNLQKFHPVPSTAVVVQCVRCWTTYHRMVQLVGSSPLGDVLQIRFSDYFYLSFMPGRVNFSDKTILCNRPNNCCQQNLKCFDEPVFSLGCFHERATITRLTVRLV